PLTYHYQIELNVFFFLQAEDGIRDRNVTGVQTCALPISYEAFREVNPGIIMLSMPAYGSNGPYRNRPGFAYTFEILSGIAQTNRSEERRVGKEGRCRWVAQHYKGSENERTQ